MKIYNVTYEWTLQEEATFQASNKKDAVKHLKEVLGDVRIIDVYELVEADSL